MRKGFTLIELLIVLAIIGILSAIVVSSINTALQAGRQGEIDSAAWSDSSI